jgi:transcriptional regulator with XRE-family HTH domain
MATRQETRRAKTKKPAVQASLAAWRERMGFSQRDAAEALGCSRQAWADWENGVRRTPRYIGLACAALALGMKPYGEAQTELNSGEE